MRSANFLKFGLSIVLIVANVPVLGQKDNTTRSLPFSAAPEMINADSILRHVEVLASDRFEGRNIGTRGEALTVNYLADQFKRGGLKPGNPDGTYIQQVPLTGFYGKPEIDISYQGVKIPLKFGEDFVHEYPRLSPSVSLDKMEVVFAGYGIVAPEYNWDDYKGLDVRNKVVILLGGEPNVPDVSDPAKPDESMFRGDTRSAYSIREYKNAVALSKGAAAVLFITDPEKSSTFSIFKTFAFLEGFSLKPTSKSMTSLALEGYITVQAVERIFKACGLDFEKLQTAANRRDFKPVPTGASAAIRIKTRLRNMVTRNVVARIEGTDPRLKSEYLIFTAHWDHLGRDENLKGDQIYNGAMDNAVGVAQLLEIARGLAANPPKRSILFILTTGEEKGWYGAKYYLRHPLYPLSETIANINIDGANVWGKTTDVNMCGYGLTTIEENFEGAAVAQGRTFKKEPVEDGVIFFGSDNIEFAKAGIPAAFPFGGFDFAGKPPEFGEQKWGEYSDKHYHQVSDEIQPDWDLSGAADDARWIMMAGYQAAQADKRPMWKAGSEFESFARVLKTLK